jgi:hypothetical protein
VSVNEQGRRRRELPAKSGYRKLQRLSLKSPNGAHYGNTPKKLPDPSTQLATLDIDQPPARGTMNAKSHRTGGFSHASNFNRWTYLPLSPLERHF